MYDLQTGFTKMYLRKIFIKELKYRDVRPIDLEKSK